MIKKWTLWAQRWQGLLCLLVVYVIWGSTYFAIRVAVGEGSGFAPFSMAGSRVLIGGLLLLAVGAGMGYSLRLTRGAWVVIVISAILLWNGGNGLVTWAEQYAHSGYAALLVGTTPLWGALWDSLIRRKKPTKVLILSLLVGFTGLMVLTFPQWRGGEFTDAASTLALCLAPVLWSAGSAYKQRRPLPNAIIVIAAYQQIVAAGVFLLMAYLSHEPWPTPSPEAWWAWGYLVVFGSFAFTAYVIALHKLSLPVVMTYAYVNPVIAVLLGWFLLDEPVTGGMVLGMVLILAAVGGVFHDRFKSQRIRQETSATFP